jgi:hypothetical protein
MRDLIELGMKPPRQLGEFKPPSGEQVRSFERHFNVSLPADYLAFLGQFNGGRPTASWFATKSGYRSCIGSFNYLLPEDPQRLDPVHHPDGWEFGNIWAETRELRKTILRVMEELPVVKEISTADVIPFARDNGNSSVFAFDVRKNSPTVCLIVVSDGFRIVPLMETFGDFIDQLYEDQSLRPAPKTRPNMIRLAPKDSSKAFPYDAAMQLLRRLPSIEISPTHFDTSERRIQPNGREVRLPQEMLRVMKEKADRGKSFDFTWPGPPQISGNLDEDMLYLRILGDEESTIRLVTSWGDELGLNVTVR